MRVPASDNIYSKTWLILSGRYEEVYTICLDLAYVRLDNVPHLHYTVSKEKKRYFLFYENIWWKRKKNIHDGLSL